MCTEKTYTLKQIQTLLTNLDSEISNPGISEGEDMPKLIRQHVTVNGKKKYLSGYTFQELADNYVELLVKEGIVDWVVDDGSVPLFGDYLKTFYETFKQGQESNTNINRDRIIRNHIQPAFGKLRIDRIKTIDLQRHFNTLGKTYSKETLLKIKNIMSPVFDAAVEDGYITMNPLSSKRLELGGKDTVHHKAIPKEKFKEIKKVAPMLQDDRERWMTGLLCYTGMRFEEVLGARWEDLDGDWLVVKRAVVHPTRNQPEVKSTKTKTSERQIPLHKDLLALLGPKYKTGFILASSKNKKRETPLSYSEARRLFDKIRKRFQIENFSAHDFRDTCATEWRENGMPLDLIARLLGHAKTETTERRYVKYRTEMMGEAKEMM